MPRQSKRIFSNRTPAGSSAQHAREREAEQEEARRQRQRGDDQDHFRTSPDGDENENRTKTPLKKGTSLDNLTQLHLKMEEVSQYWPGQG